METTIRVNTDFLSVDILDGIKKMFPHKKVKISIEEEMDETDYILSNPKFANELNDRIAEFGKSHEVVIIKNDDLP